MSVIRSQDHRSCDARISQMKAERDAAVKAREEAERYARNCRDDWGKARDAQAEAEAERDEAVAEFIEALEATMCKSPGCACAVKAKRVIAKWGK